MNINKKKLKDINDQVLPNARSDNKINITKSRLK